MDYHRKIEAIVLAVHHRNGGTLQRLDFDLRLLDPSLGLDSLDLAEIVVAIEREFRYAAFAEGTPPRIWNDILKAVESNSDL